MNALMSRADRSPVVPVGAVAQPGAPRQPVLGAVVMQQPVTGADAYAQPPPTIPIAHGGGGDGPRPGPRQSTTRPRLRPLLTTT